MKISRRTLIATTGSTVGLAALAAVGQVSRDQTDLNFKVTKRRIRQSVMGWCFKPMPTIELAKHCKAIGLEAMEGISAKDYPAVRELGLKISLVGTHGFKKGPFAKANHEHCAERLKAGIDLAVQVGCPSVITFTGMRE